jgi:tetratricopeptide (TPR) repeat protein
LSEELYAAFPGHVDFKNGLAVSYEKLGQTYTALGQLDAALEHYRQDLRLSEELHAAFPGHVAFKNGLAISYAKLAEFARDIKNDPEVAKGYFQQAEQLWAALVHDAPAFVEYQRNLGIVRKALQALEG